MVRRQILVVGASSGLGAAIALHHRMAGDDVYAVARRLHRLEMLGATSGTGKWQSIQVDMLQVGSVDVIKKRCPEADVVYICAAIACNNSSEEAFVLNTIQSIRVAEAYDRPSATIVFISSLAAVVPFPELPAYCASKAALEHWVRIFRETCKSDVIVIRPGQFESEIFERKDTLDIFRLPMKLALTITKEVERKSPSIVTLGGVRDKLAALLAPVLGGSRVRRFVLGQ
jgi:short-subunit dehydrogenase